MAPKQQPKKAVTPKAAQPQKRPPTPAKEAAKVTETVQQIATQTSKKGGTGSGDTTGLNTTKPTTQAKPRRISELPVNVGNKVAQPVVNPFDLPTNIGGKGLQPSVKPLDLPTNIGRKVAQPAVNPFDLPVNVGNKVAQPVVKPLVLPNDIGGKVAKPAAVPTQEVVETVAKVAAKPSAKETVAPAQAGVQEKLVTPGGGKAVAGAKAATPKAVKAKANKGANSEALDLLQKNTPEMQGETAVAGPASAKDNPAFVALTAQIGTKAAEQKRHESAGAASRKGQAAAKVPAGEQLQDAQANQAEAMDQAEGQEFNAAGFKQLLMERIEGMQMPESEEAAEDFDNNTNVAEINKEAVGDVAAVKGDAVGEVETTSTAAPDPNSVAKRTAAPKPKVSAGAQPKIDKVGDAMPGKRSKAEVEDSLTTAASKPDEALKAAGVSDHVLATSNDPAFTQALESKESAKTQTQEATANFRAKEATAQAQTQADAQAATNEQLDGMHGARSAGLNKVAGNQKKSGSENTSARQAVIDKINEKFGKAQTKVKGILSTLTTTVNNMFTKGANEAKTVFKSYTETEMRKHKKERYGDAWYDLRNLRRVGDAIMGLPPRVAEIYEEGRQKYIDTLDTHITDISNTVATALTDAKNAIADGKKDIKDYVSSLSPNLRKVGEQSAQAIQSKFDALEEEVAEKQDSLIDTLAEKYAEGMEAINTEVEQVKEASKGLIGKAMDAVKGIVEFYNKIKELFKSLLKNVAEAGAAIMADPIGFAKNLFSGVGQGIKNFMTNIGKHMQTGLIGWLTGASASLNITMPDNLFSAKGIFSLVSQVLGLSWNAIRGIGAQVIGERTMGILEKGFDLVMILKNEGIAGLWNHIKEEFINLKDQVIGQIKDVVVNTVINAGMKWLLSLMNPAGAIVKVVMGIVKVVQFIVERAASILELVDAFVQSIGAIAKGDVGAVAQKIEEALKRGIPLLIGMLASFLGLGNIARKVSKMLNKLRKPIVKGIKKLWKKLKKLGKKIIRKFNKKGKKKDKNKASTKPERSKEEMKEDLRAGVKEGTKLLKDQNLTKKERDKRLEAIKDTYELKELKVVTKKQEKDEKTVYIYGKVNPDLEGTILKIKGGEEEGGETIKLKKNQVAIIKASNPRHFKAILPNHKYIHLWGEGDELFIKTSKRIPEGIDVEDESSFLIKTITNTKALKNFMKNESSELDTLREKYKDYTYGHGRGKSGKKLKVDCFTFALDFLNGRLLANLKLKSVVNDNDDNFTNLRAENK